MMAKTVLSEAIAQSFLTSIINDFAISVILKKIKVIKCARANNLFGS